MLYYGRKICLKKESQRRDGYPVTVLRQGKIYERGGIPENTGKTLGVRLCEAPDGKKGKREAGFFGDRFLFALAAESPDASFEQSNQLSSDAAGIYICMFERC